MYMFSAATHTHTRDGTLAHESDTLEDAREDEREERARH